MPLPSISFVHEYRAELQLKPSRAPAQAEPGSGSGRDVMECPACDLSRTQPPSRPGTTTFEPSAQHYIGELVSLSQP